MASLKKRKLANGSKWYVNYKDENGNWHCGAASKDKGVARQMMANIVKDVENRKARLSDNFIRNPKQPIAVYLGEYKQALASREIHRFISKTRCGHVNESLMVADGNASPT